MVENTTTIARKIILEALHINKDKTNEKTN